MAEFWSNNDRGYRIRLWIDQVSQDIGGNSSKVRVRLALLNTTTTFAQYSCSAYVDLNGQRLNWSGSPSMTSNNSTIMLIDQTITVGHNADGSKSFGLMASFSGSGGWSPGKLTIGGNTFTLTTIPRSSSVSVGNGTIGSALAITINSQNAGFTHTLRYSWGNKLGTIANNVANSYSWTIPNDFANEIPNSTSGTGTIFVDTYNNGTKTGTQSVSFTASVPAHMKPTFSGLTLTDANGVARGLLSGNNFLQIISNIQVNFNGASGSYSSSITGYKAEIVNRNQVTNSNGGTLGIMNFNGSATIRASVLDSRGRWSDTRDITINVIEYFAPILSFSALRTRETPNIIQVVRNSKIAPITLSGSQKNVMTLSFKVAPLGSSSFTADNGSASGSWTTQHAFNNSAANMAGNYVATKSFVVVGTLSDKFTSTEFSATVATESVVMSYDKDGRVGIGKVVERGKAGSLDVAGDIYAGNNPIQQHRMTQNDGRAFSDYSGTWDTTITGYTIKDTTGPNPAGDWGMLQNVWSDSKKTFQMFFGFNGKIFTRQSYSATTWAWRDWREFAMKDEVLLPNSNAQLTKLNVTDTATSDFTIMSGVGISAMRKGNLVTLTVDRAIKNIQSVVEYKLMDETVPAGYRPIKEAHLIMQANTGTTISGTATVHISSDGKVRLTNNITGDRIWTGTISYLTNDPYP